jgi:carboxylesterase type B
VMIFGCSAGGASVAGHLVLPASKGMYHAAGIESPGGHQGWEAGTNRGDDDWMSAEMNLAFSDRLAKQLGCTGREDLACLRKSDLKTLYTESKKLHFAPSMDEEGSYPLGEIGKGNWNKVPTIIGGQSCESCGSAVGAFGMPNRTNPVTKEAFDAALIKAGFTGTELTPNGENKTAVGEN